MTKSRPSHWPCGHERTVENTATAGEKLRCRVCRQRMAREWHLEKYRKKYLPRAIERTRLKLVHLEREAARLGVAL